MQPQGAPAQKISLPGIRYVLAVASGKGGVGKSTVATNLAVALGQTGARVGLMDADIYGPSIPRLMGIPGPIDQNTTSLPVERYGLKLMSMGFIVPPTQAVVWRGPMVHRALTQFLTEIDWGTLDYLVIDLPPGTGDAQLTLTQNAPLTGAVIVTMPQEVSLIDARKGYEMFKQVRVPVLGIIENMSYFMTDEGRRIEMFGHGGGRKLAQEVGVPCLGEIPIDPRVTQCGDEGVPIVQRYPDSPVALAYRELATALQTALDSRGAPGALLPEAEL